jgi:hypothetical protein
MFTCATKAEIFCFCRNCSSPCVICAAISSAAAYAAHFDFVVERQQKMMTLQLLRRNRRRFGGHRTDILRCKCNVGL